MIHSLNTHGKKIKVFVLCMDVETKKILEQINLPYVICISLSDIEDDSLLRVKATRSVAEYCWTLSPCLPWYLLQRYQEIDFITYLDADLLFYSDIQPLFDEIADASIVIIEHRFPGWLKDREANGRFCVEWVSFRRDQEGLSCLSNWREQCIDWCYYRLEDGKMGDQKYLDAWPDTYQNLHILQHPGAGIAPWNYSQYQFDEDEVGRVLVQGSPLIFYHFHQFELFEDGSFYRLSNFYTNKYLEPQLIYEMYENKLKQVLLDVRGVEPNFSGGLKQGSYSKQNSFINYFNKALNVMKRWITIS